MPTSSERLQWMFGTQAWSDLKIGAGHEIVRIFHVHKAIVCRAIPFIYEACTERDDTNVRPRQEVPNVHIRENPEVVETILRHLYGFQNDRLKLSNLLDFDHTSRSLISEFRFLWDLRNACRNLSVKGLFDVTAFLIGLCMEQADASDLEEMATEVIEDEYHGLGTCAIWTTREKYRKEDLRLSVAAESWVDRHFALGYEEGTWQRRWALSRSGMKKRLMNTPTVSWVIDHAEEELYPTRMLFIGEAR